MPRIAAIMLVLFALGGRAGAAWESRTAHFRVVSEPGPEAAQAAGDHLEAVRERFETLALPLPEETGEPVVVLLFSNRASLYHYASPDSRDRALTRGLSLAGEERQWIAVAWEAPGSPLAALAHEYAHLARRDASDPLWFREGLAEYLAGLGLDDSGTAMGPTALHHLQSLQEQPWTGWEDFLAAGRMSAAFARANFYSQAWLAVRWLVFQGTAPAELQPGDLHSLLREPGREWLDAELRGFAAHLWERASAASEPIQPEVAELSEAAVLPEVRLARDWELPYWRAEFHRELQHVERAQPALERLEQQYPLVPEPSEALGALAIAHGRYDLAEEKLRAALEKGSERASTHYRYSLVLLRPVEGRQAADRIEGDRDRIGVAVWHARRAREGKPGEPRYLLAEAQALVVAGMWDAAARVLLDLQGFPGWGNRSVVEFEELLRRRRQALRSVERPRLGPALGSPFVAGATAGGLTAAWLSLNLPEVPKPEPPPPSKLIWPPPGTVLLYGYINGVECRPGEKIVSVKTPRFTIELRERSAKPARLYHPPLDWDALPCGLRGYEVNVVYRPLPAGGEVRGELVAVVF